MSLDEDRQIVYIPTGSAAPDFFIPGTRGSGEHLFSKSILALTANTGEHIWHYQIVRHDLWDFNLPAPPNLVTVSRNGREIDANDFGTTYSLRRLAVPAIDEGDIIAAGRRFYQTNCASCHGTPGRDRPSHFPDLDKVYERYDKSGIIYIINSGRGIMPPFSPLSEKEKEAIAKFLHTGREEMLRESPANLSRFNIGFLCADRSRWKCGVCP